MILGEIIRQYRTEHGISQRDFAKLCGMSNAYISMLEKNRNTKTGLPVVPSLETIKTVADTIGVSLTNILEMLGDEPLSLDSSIPTPSAREDFTDLTSTEKTLVSTFRTLNPNGRQLALTTMQSFAANPDLTQDTASKAG